MWNFHVVYSSVIKKNTNKSVAGAVSRICIPKVSSTVRKNESLNASSLFQMNIVGYAYTHKSIFQLQINY